MTGPEKTVRVIAFDVDPASCPLIVRENELGAVFDEIRTAINYAEPGDRYSVEVREMTEAEIEALPEWEGF